MSLRKSQENEVLDKEIHCPYCETDHAVLLTKITAKKISIQYPAFGLKFLLSLLYLSVVQIMIYGYKLIEAVKKLIVLHMHFVRIVETVILWHRRKQFKRKQRNHDSAK